MDKDYLYEKLAEKSLATLTKEVNERSVDNLNCIDGQLIHLSKAALATIKKTCEMSGCISATCLGKIIIADIIATATDARLKIDVEKFLKEIDAIKEKLYFLEGGG